MEKPSPDTNSVVVAVSESDKTPDPFENYDHKRKRSGEEYP
jgi:hypothetical protein